MKQTIVTRQLDHTFNGLPLKIEITVDKCEKTGKDKLSKVAAKNRMAFFRVMRHANMNMYRCGDHYHIGNNNRKPKQRGRR